MSDILDFLKTVRLFSLLDENELASLANALQRRTFQTGQPVFTSGDAGDSLYIVLNGRVELSVLDYTGEKIVLTEVSDTEVFGETSLFDLGPRSASAMASTETTLLELHRDDLMSFIKSKPAASLDLLGMMARRLRETDQMLMGRVARNLNVEFASELSPLLQAANWIANFSGSMTFLLLNAAIFTLWIVFNLEIIPGLTAFDPYPFGFLTMSVSLEAIFLSIIVLLSQNLQSARERMRNDIEYEVNLKAELEIGQLHDRLGKLHTDISQRIGLLEGRIKAAQDGSAASAQTFRQ
jgi:CRP/FNR family cyclic AMP-dependent transcriptional regulator